MVRRGIVLEGGQRSIVDIPSALPQDGLDSIPFFPERYAHWEEEVKKHRHVFLGYCGQSHSVAAEVGRGLCARGVKLIDWKRDFQYGRPLLQEIERAANQSICGIFLLTADDYLYYPDRIRAHGWSVERLSAKAVAGERSLTEFGLREVEEVFLCRPSRTAQQISRIGSFRRLRDRLRRDDRRACRLNPAWRLGCGRHVHGKRWRRAAGR